MKNIYRSFSQETLIMSLFIRFFASSATSNDLLSESNAEQREFVYIIDPEKIVFSFNVTTPFPLRISNLSLLAHRHGVAFPQCINSHCRVSINLVEQHPDAFDGFIHYGAEFRENDFEQNNAVFVDLANRTILLWPGITYDWIVSANAKSQMMFAMFKADEFDKRINIKESFYMYDYRRVYQDGNVYGLTFNVEDFGEEIKPPKISF